MTIPAKALALQQQLRDLGVERDIVHFPGGVHTAKAAADALGIEVGQIANSLIFWMADAPLLVMTSGRHRVDTDALASALGEGPIGRATPEQVRAATSQVIGGVAPIGHPAPVRTIVDAALADYDRISAAAGTPDTVFLLTFDELVHITGGTVMRVGD
ncbi:Cys-tRNA(Pro) deacylase, prolyl-tRNA editing enzyme YbaK/EbsC [Agrococcus jejuensis]|uniref:Cys-tRNA(Pro) deacylase, prolyl-tRNA editing enzyme YbaK/EbsC n=1 Tax=Agrococcus jejuensis TaxID=399736 RepID=A0A1G8C5R5_9MICO|nr:YbaK/EbsC family protein [Agrococcus jejuensis]SDH40745.1 Cys-tRNA(Pro) deacylase, prolyl-tRNA editing enzyme YbaK/EbsC [Agrococcus jejuensis]